MATFSDEFTEASNTNLSSHTPDTGTGWTYTGSNTDCFSIDAASDEIKSDVATGTYGAGYDEISPSIGQADHQVWGQLGTYGSGVGNNWMSTRIVDENNLVGLRVPGPGASGARLNKVVSGTITDLITFQPASNLWVRVKAEGNTISVWSGGTGAEPTDPATDTNWTQQGTDQTVTDHNTETSCGLASAALDADRLLTCFRAETVPPPGGGTTINATVDALTLAESASSVGLHKNIQTGSPTGLVLAESPASIALHHNLLATSDGLTLLEYVSNIGFGVGVQATVTNLLLQEYASSVSGTTRSSGGGISRSESMRRIIEKNKRLLAQIQRDDDEVIAILLSRRN